jgi:nucleotide-binding universal stress UspA family protein
MAGAPPGLTFADDGSSGADVAWLWVNNHVWPGWGVDVLMVQPAAAGSPPGPEVAQPQLWRPRVPRRLFAETQVTDLVHLTAHGDPRTVLGSLTGSALLVIGSRGSGVLKWLRLGSTAEWLLQCPPAPLVIVRHARPTGRVLVFVDGSAHATRAVHALAAHPWLGDSEVTVLGVVEHDRDPKVAVDSAVGFLSDRAGRVDSAVVRPGSLDVFINVRVDIFDAMEQLSPDLVVLGTRGLTGLRRLRVGSTASAVAHHAPCSVLLAHAEEGDGRDDDA